MDALKEWTSELMVDTIVAAVVTLLLYVVGLDHSWEDASRTFIMSFLIMFVLGAYRKIKNKK